MTPIKRSRYPIGIFISILSMCIILAACNLGASNDQVEDITSVPTNVGALTTRTLLPNVGSATVTPIPFPTRSGSGQSAIPTTSVIFPPVAIFPSSTPAPISIFILSPTSGNIVAGNIQVLGSASHPQFLQYRLEYGPDSNPNNLWFPITGIVQTPVINSTLGIWNTTTASTPDGLYQLRLRVFLRDGRQEITTVNNIRIQNQAPTPIPTNTPTTPRPIAAFTQDVSTGNAPLVVRFTNQSQGQINGYTWFFGDGTTSTETNPIHTFSRAGIYTVTLQVTGAGGTSNVSRQTSVTGINPPVASFISDKTSGSAPLAIVFTNQSSGNITGYSWDFGDGTVSTQTSPTHTFTTVGTYNVILEARGQGGTSRVVRQVTVSNPQIPAPVASFTPSVTTGDIPLTVTFTNTTTGTVTQYLWDFNGDGVTDSTDTSPTHIFTVAGTYSVKLTAIGSGGQSTASATITAQTPPNAPVANFTTSPETGVAPLTVQFTNTTTGDATGYVWDFNNDGQPDSTETNPSFNYQTAGTYTARLTATGVGGSTFIEKIISVSSPVNPPDANFTPSATTGPNPLLVSFTNTSQGDNLTFEWDFNGDNVTDSTESDPTFNYTTAGTFAVTLKATNSAGTDTATTSITVSNAVVAPIASFNSDPISGTAPLAVAFTNTSVGTVDSLSWDFNGDNVADDTTSNTPSFTYATAGIYVATLTVTNSAGSNSISQTITVTDAVVAPVAAFTTDVNTGTAPLAVAFTNTSVGTVDSLSWDFNGDNVADDTTSNTPSFTYATAGTYVATLTVTNSAGSNSISQTITVTDAIVAPVAAFTTDVNTGTAPLAVAFTNTSVGTVDSLSWDFNGDNVADDTTSNTPSFTYATAGTYVATLTVTNSAGSNSISQTITVTDAVVAPVAAFTTDVNTGTAPLAVAFTNTSVGTVDSLSWDFNGDNVADDTTSNTPSFTYATAGTYVATLTVTNSAGSNSISQTITVTDAVVAPVAAFTTDVNTGTAPLAVAFTNTSVGTVDSLSWDFNGDNVADDTTSNTPSFTYATSGTYVATLTVTNSAGSNSISQTITVTDAVVAPVAAFTTDVNTGTAPLAVAFTNTSVGTVDSLSWDFNGDNVADDTTSNTPSFTYATSGTYVATLTVTNSAGSNSISQTITVTDAIVAPVAAFTTDVNTGIAPLAVAFTNTSVGTVDSLSWDFNGDNVADDTTSNTPSFTYATAGTYVATLTVTNSAGSNSISQTITVTDAIVAPVAAFTTDVNTGTAPLAVAFTNTSVGTVDSLSWDFNGDNVADDTTSNTLTFTYNDAGTYTASLTVTNSGGSNTSTVVITVNPPPPIDRTIVFVTARDGNNEIYLIADDGNGAQNITNNGADDREPTWSPDGSKIAFVSTRDGNDEIYVLTVSDLSVIRLTNEGSIDNTPTWSPDGSRIAFTSNRSGNFDIWVMNADGSTVTQLTVDPSNETSPSWSGSQIAYVSDSTGDNNIFVMSDDGSGITQLTTETNNDHQPNFANGKIVFTSDRSGDNDIWVMNADGSSVTQLTTSSGDDQQARWSGDNNTIVFTSNRDTGNNDIYRMASDGTGQTNVTNNGTNDIMSDRK